jgi:hypothetical protein
MTQRANGTITIGGQSYDVACYDDALVVRGGEDLSESVPLDTLGDDAQEAVRRGDWSHESLSIAVESIARAMSERGG